MKADKLPVIEAAHEAMRKACIAYSDAVLSQLPMGSMVLMEHGDKWVGPYRVESVSTAWWAEPGRLRLYNPRTGKYRDAAPCQVRQIFQEDRGHE